MADLRSVFSGFDLDTGAGVELIHGVSLRLSASGGSIEALGQQVMAVSLPVVIASDQGAVSVNTEFAAAAALTDNFATPTTAPVGAFGMVYDGTTWDFARGTAVDGTLVNLGTNNDVTVTGTVSVSGTVTVDTELAVAAALTDNFATPTTSQIGAFGMLYDGATWDFARGSAADGALVNLGTNNDVTVTSGSITADTELLAPAALADAVANPSPTSLGAYLIGFNGTTWDRVRTANTGRLQVDVITGGGGTPTPTSPLADYVTSASVAAGASADLDSVEAAAKKLAQVSVWSSVAYKARVYLVNNGVEATEALAVGGGPAHTPWVWVPPHPDYAALGTSAGADTFRVEFTSMDDANAADAHAVFLYQS